jgi:ADP-ribosylglycohydrolase
MDTAKQKTASVLADRCRGAIWGQFVGDAACLGVHWIYDQNELRRTFPQGVQGFEPPAQDGYHAGKLPGDFTHYGEAALLLLQSVAELGYFSAPDFGPRFVSLFASDEYQGYLDQATKGTLENYRAFVNKRQGGSYHFQGGANDDQTGTATRLAPVVVNLCREGSLLKVVESATRVTQDNPTAVAYMKFHALITKDLLMGSDLRSAAKNAAHDLVSDPGFGKEIASSTEAVFSLLDSEVREATMHFGQSCSIQNSLPAALHCALRHQDDFRRAIVETADAGGESAGRAAMIGTWLGALQGMQGIPVEWREKLRAKEEIGRCVERIVARVTK